VESLWNKSTNSLSSENRKKNKMQKQKKRTMSRRARNQTNIEEEVLDMRKILARRK